MKFFYVYIEALFIKFSYNYFLQSYAVIAIRLLVKTCGLDKIPPFGEPIVASLLVLLKVHSLQFSLSTSHLRTHCGFICCMLLYLHIYTSSWCSLKSQPLFFYGFLCFMYLQ
jgi:hypothetical protein